MKTHHTHELSEMEFKDINVALPAPVISSFNPSPIKLKIPELQK
jgi:hypothetical protein